MHCNPTVSVCPLYLVNCHTQLLQAAEEAFIRAFRATFRSPGWSERPGSDLERRKYCTFNVGFILSSSEQVVVPQPHRQ